MVQLSFTVQGHKQMARNLRVFAKDLGDLREFFTDAIEIIGTRSDELFSREGSNVEKANTWAPLAPSTIKARQKRWGYYKASPSRPGVLRWTGNMQENRTIKIQSDKASLTFNAKQAVYHQGGGGSLSRRVVVDLSNPTNKAIIQSLQKLIHQKVGIFGRQA
jgi:hypothetical protein